MDRPAPAVPASGFAEMSLPEAFARSVAAHGRRRAVASPTWQATYAELDAAANRLAHAVLARGVASGDRVAIVMQHDAPLIAALLAVLKSGAVAVVLNPGHPDLRLRHATDDAAAALVLVDAANRARAGEIAGCATICFEDHRDAGPAHDPPVRTAPDALAVLTYTSGSSGQPKGVMQTHRRILHNAYRLTSGMGMAPEDRVALLASLSGGQGMGTAWCALANGASLWPFATMEKGVVGLAGWMIEHAISVYVSSASLFRGFMTTLDDGIGFPHVRMVRLASEVATWDDVAAFRRHFPGDCGLIHTLSSSETGNMAQFRLPRGAPIGTGRLPVGRPAPDMEVALVGPNGLPVRPGEAGEIVARSRYLASGYWRNPALTAERFAGDPAGMRSYRSGDLARINRDGLLEFVGRGDTRIKIRGHRVEPVDVEAALLGLPEVQRAVVLAWARPDAEQMLVAWLVPDAGRAASPQSLRRSLRALLPDHMVPAAFVLVPDFPLTPHGKIDHDALRARHPPVRALGSAERPRTATEERLAAIWMDVLGLAQVGRHHDFFEQGGDSLAAAVVAARVHAELGAALNLAAFTDHTTLAALAGAVDALHRAAPSDDMPPIAAVPRDGPLPLSFFQERAWLGSQTAEGMAGYTGRRSYRILGALDIGILRACMADVARRHEILRTSYAVHDGRPVQVVHPPGPVALAFADLAGATDPEAEAARFLAAEAARPLDLARPPLMRFALARVRENEHWLLRVSHHIMSDSWSWRVYFRELALLYEARQRGEPPPLPAAGALQYADFAAWQREALHPGTRAHQARLAWWRELLADRPRALDLRFRRAVPVAGLAPELGKISWGIDAETTQRLNEIARSEGATFYAVRLAALAALLAAESGRPDVVIGTYVSNRARVEVQEMFGFFINLAILRLRYAPALRFRDWLAAVRRHVGEVEAHGDIPYEELRQQLAREGATPPDLRVIATVSAHRAPARFGGLTLVPRDNRSGGMPWGFQVGFSERDEARDSRIEFDAGLYDPHDVRGFVGSLQRLLDAVSRRPDAAIGALVATSARPPARRWRRLLGFLPALRRAT